MKYLLYLIKTNINNTHAQEKKQDQYVVRTYRMYVGTVYVMVRSYVESLGYHSGDANVVTGIMISL